MEQATRRGFRRLGRILIAMVVMLGLPALGVVFWAHIELRRGRPATRLSCVGLPGRHPRVRKRVIRAGAAGATSESDATTSTGAREPTPRTMAARASSIDISKRDLILDIARVFCAVLVVVIHLLMVGVGTGPHGSLVVSKPLEEQPWFAWATWVGQIMPLFFVVGGFASLSAWRSLTRRCDCRVPGLPAGVLRHAVVPRPAARDPRIGHPRRRHPAARAMAIAAARTLDRSRGIPHAGVVNEPQSTLPPEPEDGAGSDLLYFLPVGIALMVIGFSLTISLGWSGIALLVSGLTFVILSIPAVKAYLAKRTAAKQR